MAQVNLTKTAEADLGADAVVVPLMLEDVAGGRTLDVTDIGADETVIKAGHVILKHDSNGSFKALGLQVGGAYETTYANYDVFGILYVSIPKDAALASIMVRGTVNEKAAEDVYGLPEYIKAIKDALPLIRFIEA